MSKYFRFLTASSVKSGVIGYTHGMLVKISSLFAIAFFSLSAFATPSAPYKAVLTGQNIVFTLTGLEAIGDIRRGFIEATPVNAQTLCKARGFDKVVGWSALSGGSIKNCSNENSMDACLVILKGNFRERAKVDMGLQFGNDSSFFANENVNAYALITKFNATMSRLVKAGSTYKNFKILARVTCQAN